MVREHFSWRRLGARLTDWALFFGFLSALLIPVFQPTLQLGLSLASPILWILPETIFLKVFRKTFGMLLFGLELEAKQLTFGKAFKHALFLSASHPMQVKRIGGFRWFTVSVICLASILFALYAFSLNEFTAQLQKQIFTTGWIQYSPSDQRFTVTFPKDPSLESKQLEIPNSDRVLLYEEIKSVHGKGGVTYAVSYMELPSKWLWAGANTLLKGALELLIKTSQDKPVLLQKWHSTHQGYSALDFHLMQKGQEVKGRLILSGKTLYKLTVTYAQGKTESSQDQSFFSSFILSSSK
jgi:RDD family